ncbi:MAG: hypothetical protein HYW50_01855 [Candidatus Diapherotrites archaeon]|nr:hypothetical protein [Candidatus Diapherotrites archaeon]
MQNIFYISIGSNIKKEKNIKKCAALLKKRFKKIRFSSVFETKPERKRTKIKSGPRTIDLDLIIWNKKTVGMEAGKFYSLLGLKEIINYGEAEKKLEKMVLRQRKKKTTAIKLN